MAGGFFFSFLFFSFFAPFATIFLRADGCLRYVYQLLSFIFYFYFDQLMFTFASMGMGK